jgi:hypothetical protein
VSVRLQPGPGYQVVKAAQALPQTATANLFAVSGAVLVTGLFGLVTVALGAVATTLSLGTTVSGTSIATATSVASKAAGTWLVPQNSSGLGGALITTDAPYIPNAWPGDAQFMTAAANITWTTSASDTGQVRWYLWYIPIDADASVT